MMKIRLTGLLLALLLLPKQVEGRRLATPQQQHWQEIEVDLVFIIDGSGSVDEVDWAIQKNGIVSAFAKPKIVPRDGSFTITVIQFASDDDVEIQTTLIDSEEVLAKMARDIVLIEQKEGDTHPGDGVLLATKYMKSHARENARQVFCVTTDEVSSDGSTSLKEALTQAKEDLDYDIDTFSVVAISGSSGTTDAAFQSFYVPLLIDGELGIAKDAQEFADLVESACFDYHPGVKEHKYVEATIDEPSDGDVFYDNEVAIKLKASVNGPYSKILWFVDSKPEDEGETAEIDPSEYEPDFYKIGVAATNKNGLQGPIHAITIEIRSGNEAPVVVIKKPKDGQEFLMDDLISLKATVIDAEDGEVPDENVFWYSIKADSEGEEEENFIGTGKSLKIYADELGAGDHTIFVFAVDSEEEESEHDEVSITIRDPKPKNNAPTIQVLKPKDGAVYSLFKNIKLKATATDKEDGDIPDEDVVWRVGDEIIAFGKTVKVKASELGEGTHFIEASATDSKGKSSEPVGRTIKVRDPNPKHAPVPTIVKPPLSGQAYWDFQWIVLECTVVDADGEEIPDENIIWASMKGPIAIGRYAEVSASDVRLGPGVHKIQVTATDGDELSGKSPVATITIKDSGI